MQYVFFSILTHLRCQHIFHHILIDPLDFREYIYEYLLKETIKILFYNIVTKNNYLSRLTLGVWDNRDFPGKREQIQGDIIRIPPQETV